MHTDQQGIPLNKASAAGASLYQKILDGISIYHPDNQRTIDAAIAENPEFALPYFAKAYNSLAATQPSFWLIARETMDAFDANVPRTTLNDSERAHLAAVNAWLLGDPHRAKQILDQLGIEQPRDYLCLRMGHKLDFITGHLRNLRDRIARQLMSWSDQDHHIGYLYGCYAYGLVENGRYEEAAEWGLRALEKDRRDVWALHAVAHSFEMRGMIGEGCHFMASRVPDWGADNLFKIHNWWHYGLFHLDQLDYPNALRIFDESVFNDQTSRIALCLIDAAALLWRISLDGKDVQARFAPIAAAWTAHLTDTPFSAFNEIHAVMAMVGAAQLDNARYAVKRLRDFSDAPGMANANQLHCRRVALPICEALLAFGAENYARTVSLLADVRCDTAEIGGSTAQRDVIDRTLVEAALRAGDAASALAYSSERTTTKPTSPHNWNRAAAALALSGRTQEAVEATARANALADQTRRRLLLEPRGDKARHD